MKWVLLSITVTATALADLLQSHEMKRAVDTAVGARGLARLVKFLATRINLILSIVCLAVSFFAFMALVQAEPLSFAVPASASSFILETVAAKFILKEHVGMRRAAGALLVLGGVILIAR
ncbi:MAG TPA: EamA family transporter [Bryobacteraceae bacterium]|nr:EamA family transporter [Bryobacteraceae bacterium]